MKNKFVLSCLAVFFSVVSSVASGIARFDAAKPVWPENLEKERNLFVGFRTDFSPKEGGRSVLRITGSSAYRVSLNGEFLHWGPARAAKGHFRVDEIPLKVRDGVNMIAIEVAGYNCNSFYFIDQPSFLQAEILVDGKVVRATGRTGDFAALILSSKVQKVARYSFQRTYSELYRFDRWSGYWKTRSPFSSAGSKLEIPGSVALAIQKEAKLLPRRAPYPDFAVNGPFKPVSRAKITFDSERKTRKIRSVDDPGPSGRGNAFAVEELEENWWDLSQRYIASDRKSADANGSSKIVLKEGESMIFDAGLNDTGFPMLNVKCTRPGKIAFRFDEILLDGEVSPVRYECANVVVWDLRQPGVYTLEAFEPYTFRYADVMACSGDFEIRSASLRTYKNPDAKRAKLVSSDASLVRIFEAARETFVQNAADVFTDCPGRERAGWLCDSFFTARSSLLFTGSLDCERLFLENYVLPDKFDHLPDGMFAMCYPGDFPTKSFIPNWAMWLVLEVEEYKLRGGDQALVEAYRPKLVKLVNYLKTFRNSDGLLERLPAWVFVEWSHANSLTKDVNYPSNMMWAEVLSAMDRLYGMPELAAEAERVRETVRRQSWTGEWFCDNAKRQEDGTLKLSGECTETCQYYAFYFKTATKDRYPRLWKTLVDDFGPKRKNTKKHPEIWPSNAFIGNYLRLECLSREGLSKKILEETYGFFLYMAERTGTLWEYDSPTASCNHGFASHVAVAYVRDVVGLRSIDHVAKKVVFAPPTDLDLESIEVDLPVGDGEFIKAGWKRESGKIAETLSLPKNWSRLR